MKKKKTCPIFLIQIIIFFILCGTGYAQNGLTKIMDIEDALMITRQSIQRASGIRLKKENVVNKSYKKILGSKYVKDCLTQIEINKYEKLIKNDVNAAPTNEEAQKLQIRLNKCFLEKRIRLTDSIGFLGITDEFRLGTLRRYIVRNSEIGVKSIWNYNNNDVAQFFILTNEKIENISAKTTVTELALLIQKNAGLPYLPYVASESVIKNCRIETTGKIDEISTKDVKVSNDLKVHIDKFIQCLQGITDKKTNKEYGVISVKIKDGSGDTFQYHLTKKDADNFKTAITDNGWNYQNLIKELGNKAVVPSSSEFVATKFVINTILNLRNADIKTQLEDNKIKTFRLAAVFHEVETPYEVNRSKVSRCDSGDPKKSEFTKTTLKDLCISPELIVRKFIENSERINNTGNKDYLFLGSDGNPKLPPVFSKNHFSTGKIKSKIIIDELITIDELIELIVRKITL